MLRLLHCLLKETGGPRTACGAPMPCYGRRICRLCHVYLTISGILTRARSVQMQVIKSKLLWHKPNL